MSATTALNMEGWLTEDSLPELENLLCTVETKWRQLGLQLGIPSYILDAIESDYQKTQDRFSQMLKTWINRQLKPTKEDLVAALRSNALQENRLADQVESWTQQGQQETSVSDHSRSCGPANWRITCILSRVRQANCLHLCITAAIVLFTILLILLLFHFFGHRYMEPDQPESPPMPYVQSPPPDLPTLQPIVELSTLTSEPLIGREKDKQVILNWLEFQTSPVQIVSIVGSPGVGKSALARDVGHTMVQKETKIYYADMFNGSHKVQPLISKPLEEWMEKVRHPTLLIFDNCDHYLHRQKEKFQDLLDSLQRRNIKVLITSQVGNTLTFPRHRFEEYHLQKLEKDRAVSLLQDNIEGLHLSTADYSYICDLVDNNPLALISIAADLKSKSMCDLKCIITRLENDPIELFSSFTELPRKLSVVSSIKLAYDYLDPKYQKYGWQLARIPGPVDETALAAHMKPYDSAETFLDTFTKHSLLEYSKFTLVKQGAKFCVSHQVYLEVMCESSNSTTKVYKLPRLVRYYFLRVSKNLPEQLLSTAPAHVPIETQFKYIWMPKCAPNWSPHKVVLSSYADEMLPIVPRHADQTLHAVVEVGVKAFYWGILNNFYETDLKFAVSSLELLDNIIAEHFMATSNPKGTDQTPRRMPESENVLAAYVYFNHKSLGIEWSTKTQCPNPSEAVSSMLKRKPQVELLHLMTGNDLAWSAYRAFYIDLCLCCLAAPRSTPECRAVGLVECLVKGIVDQAVAMSNLFQHVPPCDGSPAVVPSNTLHQRQWPWQTQKPGPHRLQIERECAGIITKIETIITLYKMCEPKLFNVKNHWSYKLIRYGLPYYQNLYYTWKCKDRDPIHQGRFQQLKGVREGHINFLILFYTLERASENISLTRPTNLLSNHCELAYWVYNTSYKFLMPYEVHHRHDQSYGQTTSSHVSIDTSVIYIFFAMLSIILLGAVLVRTNLKFVS